MAVALKDRVLASAKFSKTNTAIAQVSREQWEFGIVRIQFIKASEAWRV